MGGAASVAVNLHHDRGNRRQKYLTINERRIERESFDHIKRAGVNGITDGKIGDRCGSIDKKRREALLSDLVAADRVEVKSTITKGRPRRRYFTA